MKIPNKIKIGAHTFDVLLNSANVSNDDNFGTCSLERLQIFIKDGVAPSLKEETFFHEVLHLIRQIHGLELDDKDEEEKIVQSEAHALYLFLKENNLLQT